MNNVDNQQLVPANNIWDAWDMLTLEPLGSNDSRYVDCSGVRETNVVQKLCAELRLHSKHQKYMHLPFTGYRGDGKTTELFRFIDEIKNEYRPLYFNAENEFDLKDFRFPDFLLGIARVVFDRMNEQGLSISQELLDSVANWFAEIVEIVEQKTIKELKAEAGVSIPDWFKFITGNLIGTIKTGGEKRKEVRKKLNQRLATLINYVDKLLSEAAKISEQFDNRELVVVLDNLDRLNPDLAFDLFYTNGQNLCTLNCHFVYVVPIALIYLSGASQLPFNSIILMQMIPVYDSNNASQKNNVSHLKRVLEHRFIPEKIITTPESIMEKLILASGGHLRDLVRLFQHACRDAVGEPEEKINDRIAQRAINEPCETYENTVYDEDYEYLIETYKTKDAGNNERKQRLIFGTVILKYGDEFGNKWEDVHPTLVQGGKFQKLLNKS